MGKGDSSPYYLRERELLDSFHFRKLYKRRDKQKKDKMTSEIIPGVYENGIIKPSKKLDITGKREVLIIFKEKREESMVDLIIKKIRPIEDEMIDEAIELTER